MSPSLIKSPKGIKKPFFIFFLSFKINPNDSEFSLIPIALLLSNKSDNKENPIIILHKLSFIGRNSKTNFPLKIPVEARMLLILLKILPIATLLLKYFMFLL